MPPNRVGEELNNWPATAVDMLLDHILDRAAGNAAPRIIGLTGVQGSGKSTLAAQLEYAAKRRGIATVVMSLDDFYLARRERVRLAHEIHPLFATRGVPGTHDLALLSHVLNALTHASEAEPVLIPRFDKGLDTRLPRSRWRSISARPQLIVLEGWCVGIPAQTDASLAKPINALERDEDSSGAWRRSVNARLRSDYQALWNRLNALIVLAAPNFDVVPRWRGQAERKLRNRGAARALSPRQMKRFVQHFERLSRHALRVLSPRADIVIELDERRRVIGWNVSPRCGKRVS